jgi:excisionase family DNA binding protein
LTLGVVRCHNRATGSAPKFRSVNWGAPVVGFRGAVFSARGSVLVSESREVMNVRQASQYLGISPDTLYRYITEGEIPAFKLGNRWKLRKTILDRWMERKMNQVQRRR